MDETLKSLSVQRRELEKQNLRIQQQKEFEKRLVDFPSGYAASNQNAFNDKYMKDAYAQELKSKVTHNEDLLRKNGTWFYKKTINPDL